MTFPLALTISLATVMIALCFLAILSGLVLFARDLHRTTAALERLASRVEAKLDPLEQQVNETLTEAQRTLDEVRVQAASIGETHRLVQARAREVSALLKFVTERAEGPIVSTVSAAAGLRAGLGVLLDAMRKRKEGAQP